MPTNLQIGAVVTGGVIGWTLLWFVGDAVSKTLGLLFNFDTDSLLGKYILVGLFFLALWFLLKIFKLKLTNVMGFVVEEQPFPGHVDPDQDEAEKQERPNVLLGSQ